MSSHSVPGRRWPLTLYPVLLVLGGAALLAAARLAPPARAAGAGLGAAWAAFAATGTMPGYLLAAAALWDRLGRLRTAGVFAASLAAVAGTPAALGAAWALARVLAGPQPGLARAAYGAAYFLGAGLGLVAGYAAARRVPGWRGSPAA